MKSSARFGSSSPRPSRIHDAEAEHSALPKTNPEAAGPDARSGHGNRLSRSRLALCDAYLDLVREGELRPGAERIAERAGLSRRSLFHHFEDLPALYSAAVQIGTERCAPLLEPVPGDLPIAERIDTFCQRRGRFMETTAPYVRALAAHALEGPASKQAKRYAQSSRRLQRTEIETLFARELSGVAKSERSELVEAFSMTTSPANWEYLRRSRRQSNTAARAIMARTLKALLRDVGVEIP